jgi:3-oxoacyl-[acyl-carrier protein] reductase
MNILITGGASGLGETITKTLAANAANQVFFTYSNSQANALKIEKEYANAKAYKCDFKNQAELESFIETIKELQVDVLINNAYSGTPVKTYFHKIPAADFLEEFQQNILPTIAITQAVLTNFRKARKGKIITILTSFLINTPPIGASSYVACKAYLASLVKSWANENAKFNISSNSVSPSFMMTGLTNDTDERIIEQMEQAHPLKKLLTTDEVAETIRFLASASFQLNGVDIPINAASDFK